MLEERVAQTAQRLADAWQSCDTIDFPPDLLPRDRAEAYAVQDRMAHLIAADDADEVVGWKVGTIDSGVQEAEGYDGPVLGRIFASTLYASPALVPLAFCPHANLEAEIAFVLTTDLDPYYYPFSTEDLAKIVVLHPAFNVTSTRYHPVSRTSWNTIQNMLADIADNGNGGAIVMGPEVSDWYSIGLMNLQVDLRINSGEPVRNLFGQSRGGPFEALVWTVNDVCKRGFGFQAGDAILTGSLTEPQPLTKGDQAGAHFPGIGEMSVVFS